MRGSGADTHGMSRPRRVLIVTDGLANGGIERQLTLLVKALPSTWEARIVSLADGVYAPILRDAGFDVSVFARRFRFDVSPVVPLSRLIRTWRPDVVHCFGWMSTAASLAPCRLAGIPIVDATIQDGAVPPRRGPMMRRMTRAADVVIANSQAGLEAFGVDPTKGIVVHNGFDPARWALCDGGNPPESPTTVVMAARMHPHKDYRSFLEAARILSVETPGAWRFLAVGSGDDRGALMADFDDLLHSGVLEFPDGGTEVLGIVRDTHIGVLLTNAALHAEGLPNSIMEYMACGLPVVCTGTGGNPELVLDGESGILVPPADVAAVVGALRTLRRDPERARRMGAAGRERIATVFTVDALVAGTLAAYDRALAGRRS